MADLTNYFAIWLKVCGIALLLVGWGYLTTTLIERILGTKRPFSANFSLFEYGVIGLPSLYVFSVVVSLFAPLSTSAHLTFVIIGTFGLGSLATVSPLSKFWASQEITLGASLCAFMGYGAAHSPWNYDAGLYYLQALSYFRQGPLALGLANIHHRLGFNSAWFPLSALCGGPLFGTDGIFLLSAAATALFLGAMLHWAFTAPRSSDYLISRFYGVTASLLFLSIHILFSMIGLSPSADLPAALTCAYAFMAFLNVGTAFQTADDSRQTETQKHLLLLVCSASLSFVTKVLEGPILLLIPLAIGLGIAQQRSWLSRAYKYTLAISGIIIGVWALHGLMLSGCLVFPAQSSCVGFLPWTISKDRAVYAGVIAEAWAKAPAVAVDQVPPGLGWIHLWREKMLPFREYLPLLAWISLGLILCAISAAVVAKIRPPKEAPSRTLSSMRLWVALATAVIGSLIWFLKAPDPRFGLGFLIAMPALIFAYFITLAVVSQPGMRLRWTMSLLALLTLGAAIQEVVNLHGRSTDLFVWRSTPVPTVRSVLADKGVVVRMPVEGNQCWAIETPCTPEPPQSLYRAYLFGHMVYSHSDNIGFGSEVPTASDFQVILGPKTWGAEPSTRRGKQFNVRWLQSETSVKILNTANQPAAVEISTHLESFGRTRQVHFVVNDKPTPELFDVKEVSPEAEGQAIVLTTTLQPGENTLILKTDGPESFLPGNRAVSQLLIGDITVKSVP
jgi:hypothetical protein